MNNPLIRLAQESDIQQMHSIYNYYVDNSSVTFDYETPELHEFSKKITHLLEKYPVLIYEEKGSISGYAYASLFREKKAYQWTVETTIYLKPDVRGNGIGTMLYSKLISILQQQKFRIALAVITIPNEESIKFHRKLGFYECGILEEIGYKFNDWRSVQLMRLQLNNADEIPEDPLPLKEINI
jgi:phosphinothricin acetyltransferase